MTSKSAFSKEMAALTAILDALDSLENDDQRSFVYRTAGERFGIVVQGRKTKRREEGSDDSITSGQDNDIGTPKEFMHDKSPKTDVERVACLAYYLTKYRETLTFKTKDITNLHTEAALPKMSNPSQTMKNATNQNHYLATAGQGAKQITMRGEKVVDALPDREKVAAVLAKHAKPKRRKKRTSKNNTK